MLGVDCLTEDTLIRLGLEKLLNYLNLGDYEDLVDFMVDTGYLTLEDLSDYMAEFTRVCEHCGNDYINIEDGAPPLCKECLNTRVYNL